MASLDALLDDYEQSHRHPTNIAIHWVAEPIAIVALMALAASIPLPVGTALWPFLAILMIYFARLSRPIALAFVPVIIVFIALIHFIDTMLTAPTWVWAVPTFSIAWVSLLIGHKIEGRVPSVFQNPNLIVIGPAWLMRRIFRKLGLKDP